MVEARINKTTDPTIQYAQQDLEAPLDAAAHRGNIQKKKSKKGKVQQDTHFDIKVDISDKNANYYDGMNQMSGVKKKHRHW